MYVLYQAKFSSKSDVEAAVAKNDERHPSASTDIRVTESHPDFSIPSLLNTDQLE